MFKRLREFYVVEPCTINSRLLKRNQVLAVTECYTILVVVDEIAYVTIYDKETEQFICELTEKHFNDAIAEGYISDEEDEEE